MQVARARAQTSCKYSDNRGVFQKFGLLDKHRLFRMVARIGRKLHAGGYSTGSGGHCKTVAPFIFRMPRVTFDPVERHAMALQKCRQTHPQFRILHLRIPLALPVRQPSLIDSLHHI